MTADRRSRPHSGTHAIRSVLDGVLKAAREHHGALFEVQQAWPSIVGEPLASHTKPVSLRGGRLTVHVEKPGDGFLFNYQRVQVLARVREMTKGQVTEMVMRAGQV